MTGNVRGRALIINIINFSNTKVYRQRTGSDVDYRNIARLFKDLRFDIVKSQSKLTDLTVEVIYGSVLQLIFAQSQFFIKPKFDQNSFRRPFVFIC